jgi:basic membrane protein A
VYDTIKEAVSPAGMTYTPYVGTLANGGVGIAPFASGTVSADVQTKLTDLTKGIIAGTIKTTPGA